MAYHKLKRRLAIGFLVFVGIVFLFYSFFQPSEKPVWGLNFSPEQADYLGLDWVQAYRDILDELEPKRLRVMAYWDTIEREPGKFWFLQTDYLLQEAEKRGVSAIVVLGLKQPRWPECHQPKWAENQNEKIKNENLLNYIKKSVEHFKGSKAVVAWQIENEPFFEYGPDCPEIAGEFYRQEIALVKGLDSRPVIATDSGEKGLWVPTARAGGDVFGATIYREIYHSEKKEYIKYAIPPALYRIKAGLVRVFAGVDKFVGVELQAEPWFATDVHSTSWQDQKALMNEEIFEDNVRYARAVGFPENYLWGAEWWYYAKQKQGDDSLWQAAKKLLAE